MSLEPGRWSELERLFHEALARPPAERTAFADEACGPDHALRDELARLLAADEGADPAIARIVGEGARAVAGTLEGGPTGDARLGPYRLIREIARGGMGTVWLAERADDEFRRSVAIKLILPGTAGAGVVPRFLAERQILAGLDHPNIARLLDGGTTPEGWPYLVMEHIEGEPIDRYCERHGLDLEARLGLFVAVCSAVQFAHARLIVHRDIKPGNILVAPDGVPKLLDFGIAKILAADGGGDALARTATGLHLMSAPYASPEQIKGDSISIATDVYSLGVLLYELLAGRLPYPVEATSPHALAEAILSAEPERPSVAVGRDGARALAGDLDDICMMALRKEPDRRYPSVEALREDVVRHLAGRPVKATPDTPSYRLRKFVGRNRGGVLVATASVVLLAGVTAAFTIGLAAERDRATLEAENAAEVSDFLQGLFEVSDPAIGTDREVTARQLLDDGAARIEGELAGQPALQARMRGVVGDVYRGLGLTSDAERLLGQALALNEELYGQESLAVAETLTDLGDAIGMTDVSRAETLHRQALDLKMTLLGDEHPDVADGMRRLALVLTRLGRSGEAEELATTALRIQRPALGPDHAEIASSLSVLGLAQRAGGRSAEAEASHREALAMQLRLLDPSHPDVLASMGNLAIVVEERGAYEEAEALHRERVERTRGRLGPEHPETLVALNNLAFMLTRTGHFAEAEPVFRDVVDIGRRVHGGDHTALAIFMNNLAVVLNRLQDFAAADSIQRQALEMNRRLLGEEHPRVAADLANYGGIRQAQGDLEGAERLYREALAMRRRLLEADHPAIAESLYGLGNVLRDTGALGEAESLLREAATIRRARLGEDSPSLAETLHNLGVVLRRAGRLAEAEGELGRALALRVRVLGPEHPNVAATRRELAGVLRDGERYAEAEELLLEVYEAAAARGEARGPALLATLDELVALYRAWGRPADAERFERLRGAP